MKTGDYAYFDGTISPEFDKDKKAQRNCRGRR